MAKYEGRLELSWTNKHRTLLAHEDGSYEWVKPSDYRVAEVRLLHDVATVGEVGKNRASNNLLIRGDALNALTSLARLPEFASEYLGKVKLVYVDPPFNTQQSFLHYDDALEHSVWLTMMRDRLLQIQPLLAPGGSIWVHLDDAEVSYCRVMMDEVFGRPNFVAEVVWRAADSSNNDAKRFSVDHNTLSWCTRLTQSGGRIHCRERMSQMPITQIRTMILGGHGSPGMSHRRIRERTFGSTSPRLRELPYLHRQMAGAGAESASRRWLIAGRSPFPMTERG